MDNISFHKKCIHHTFKVIGDDRRERYIIWWKHRVAYVIEVLYIYMLYTQCVYFIKRTSLVHKYTQDIEEKKIF